MELLSAQDHYLLIDPFLIERGDKVGGEDLTSTALPCSHDVKNPHRSTGPPRARESKRA